MLAFTRERGLRSVVTSSARWGFQWLLGRMGRFSTPREFELHGRAVPYWRHRYNHTWLNERAVEVALARDQLQGAATGARILEVGNVLAHYEPVDHLVVDKYEQADGVLNVDVADLRTDGSFDLILSVSTLEHVGLDEDVLDPAKPGRAIEMLKGLLAPGGRLWVTIPVGYNLDLDAQLRDDSLGFTALAALRREPTRNAWRQVPVAEVWAAEYDRLLYTAHGLVVAEYARPE